MKQPHWLANYGADFLREQEQPTPGYLYDYGIGGSSNSNFNAGGRSEEEDRELAEISARLGNLFGAAPANSTFASTAMTSSGTTGVTTPASSESGRTSPAIQHQQELYSVPQRRGGWPSSPVGAASSPPTSSRSSSASTVQEKTILCKFYAKGNCTRGDRCTFAHGIGDIKAARAGSKSSGSSPNPLKKTKLCRNLFGKYL